ncbi:MAG: glycosyltransferase family 2 protein, partial [Pseudomonadota bacterium]
MSEERKYGRRASDGPAVDLSIVVPMLNEEEGLDLLFERLEPILESITEAYEIVCVDDGSTDGTMASLVQHRVRNPRIKVLSLSRNFGKDVALSAGLNHACGQAVVPMDSDLQDPPELIPQMWEKKAEGYDVVLARRAGRESDGWLKRITAQAFYRVHNRMAEIAIPDDTGDFRMMDRKVIEVLRHLPERTRFMKGLFAWVGFSHCEITYEREARAAGTTKWRYWKLWNFALDGITASSSLPLRMWTYLGGALATFAIGFALWTAVRVMIWGVDVPGYASLMTAILFLGGINIFATGILGEYLGRVYTEVRNRPLYVVREEHGLTSSEQDTWNDRSST